MSLEETRWQRALPTTDSQKQTRKMNLRLSFPIKGRVSQHIWEACGKVLTERKNISEHWGINWNWIKQQFHYFFQNICVVVIKNSFSYNWFVKFTYLPMCWSRLGRNRYRSNRFSPTPLSLLIPSKVPLFINNLVVFKNNSPFQELSAVIKVKLRPS